MCCVMPPASPAGDVRLADRVEQRRLAVVDVAHDRDHRRARHQILGILGRLVGGQQLVLAERGRLDLVAELHRHQRRGLEVDVLVDVGFHHPQGPQLLDDLAPLHGHLLRQLRHGDRVAHADDALVLGGGGDLRLLQLLAGGGDPLLGDATRALTAGAEARTAELVARTGRRARQQRRASETAQLLVAVLDLEARRRGLARRPHAGELDERARRGGAGDDRLRDLLERALRQRQLVSRCRAHRRRRRRGRRRLSRQRAALRRARRRRRARRQRGRPGAARGPARRPEAEQRQAPSRAAARRARPWRPPVRQARARAAAGPHGLATGRRRRRGGGRRYRRTLERALRTAADDGVVEADLFEVLEALALDGAAHAVDVGRLEVRHVIRDLEAHGADLRHEVLRREVQILRQLVYAQARSSRRFRFCSALVSASHHDVHNLFLRESTLSCCDS